MNAKVPPTDHGKLVNTVVRLIKHPDADFPKNIQENLRVESEILENLSQKLEDNQVLVEVLYVSVDPTMRVWMTGQQTYIGKVELGQIFPGLGVGRIMISKSPKFKTGDIAVGMLGFQSFAQVDAKILTAVPKVYPNPQNFLGVLGTNGLTAYIGLMEIGKPKKGETVVISTAAGAVGQIACQIAKQQGCYVVGIAGGKDKCHYVVNTIGADSCIDYKAFIHDEKAFTEEMKKHCPKGVDVYFDNVGGRTLDCMLNLINENARIIACGAISTYNYSSDVKSTPSEMKVKNYPKLINKNSKMQGFLYFDHKDAIKTGSEYLMGLLNENKLKFSEDITQGIENTHEAFKKLFTGKNTGKTMIQVVGERPRPRL